MNLVRKLKQILYPILVLRRNLLFWHIKLLFNKSKTIYVFGAPDHSNLGDNAQSYCIISWAKKHFPQHKVIVFRQFIGIEINIIKTLTKYIREEDLLFCHSGYHITDMYPLHIIYEAVVSSFPNNPVVIFPQTVNFKNQEAFNKLINIFDSHSNLTLLCRDEISYATAQKSFKNTRLLLFPDIVTSLIGCRSYSHKRDGVLFCMRNDIEALFSKDQIAGLKARFTNVNTFMSDTTIRMPYKKLIKQRDKILENTFEDYSKYKVIITDRYHGTIFSVIANTPVVVVNSADHKLSSGVKWFPQDVFQRNVQFARTLDEAYTIAMDILNNPPTEKLPPYFLDNYYDKLPEQLGLI